LMETSEQKLQLDPDFDQSNNITEKIGFLGCRYHEYVYQRLLDEVKGSRQNLSPLERFLEEDVSQKHALIFRPTEEIVLTRKDCSCKTFDEDLVISDGEND
jgi:hypothetical protein